MTWDKKDEFQFSVRSGPSVGKASENRMLDAMGGQDTIKKRFQTGSDGSVTMAHTRGPGTQPEFITTQPESVDTAPMEYYMESGQLEFSWPGPENPTRAAPAKWRFLDIPTAAPYLGYIGMKAPNTGVQANKPALAEGQDSLAIGYPHSTDYYKEQDTKAAYTDTTVSKKMLASIFPASLYSGKMRLFLQAQYGAREFTTTGGGLHVVAIGSSFVLRYAYGDTEITLGLWTHNSPGIFTAPDNTWWLLLITNPTGNGFVLTAYPIRQTAAGQKLLEAYKTSNVTGADKEKLEAYIFAHSYIDTGKPLGVGTFTGSAGGALAYGWKWKSDGSEAAIVLHETIGSYSDRCWKASTVKLSISYANGYFHAEQAITVHGDWTDGWGGFNIFVPEDDIGTRLECKSIAMDTLHVREEFDFNNIHVYGHYKNDVWTPVVMARLVQAWGTAQYSQSYTGLRFNSTTPLDRENLYEDGYFVVEPGGGFTYESHRVTQRTTMTIAFDGTVVNGLRDSGTHNYNRREIGAAGPDLGLGVGQGQYGPYPQTGGGVAYENAAAEAPGMAAINAAYAAGEFPQQYTNYCSFAHSPVVVSNWSFGGERYLAWTLIIPGRDAEAAYIASKTRFGSGTWSRTVNTSIGDLSISVETMHGVSGQTYQMNPISTTLPWGGEYTAVNDNEAMATSDVEVRCFNSTLSGEQGTPAHSYTALFEVDKTYPFYDAGMFFTTSAGKRYIGSEGIKSPDSVLNQPFVGWA